MHPDIEIEPLDADALFDPAALAALLLPEGSSVSVQSMYRICGGQAPGLHCLGVRISLAGALAREFGANGFSATGKGASLADAEASLVGEIFETLSQIDFGAARASREARGERIAAGWIGQKLAELANEDGLDWLAARHGVSGAPAVFPADLCLRRAPDRLRITPAGALSAGCAAGAGLADAAERAILELVERDAAAHWWLAGALPCAIHPESAAGMAGASLLSALGYDSARRVPRFLDISGDSPAPVAAAVSFCRDGGRLATGVAAGRTLQAAVAAAALELCQMELAGALVRLKAAEGQDLTAQDRTLLARDRLDSLNCVLLHPDASTSDCPPTTGDDEPLARRLKARGVDVYLADLTHPVFGVPVVRALSPDLQPFSRDVRTVRFAEALSRLSESNRHHSSAALYF